MTKNLSESPENIIRRLEKLRLWQEEQQQTLLERQNAQRQMINLEKWKMYEMLGLSRDSPIASNTSDNNLGRETTTYDPSEEGISLLEDDGILQNCSLKNANTSPVKIKKRPFLKRGEGLTNRFKVDPDTFRLHNLPKYKYANSHKRFLKKQVGKKASQRAANEETNKQQSNKYKKAHSPVQKKSELRLHKSNLKQLSNPESNNEIIIKMTKENISKCNAIKTNQENKPNSDNDVYLLNPRNSLVSKEHGQNLMGHESQNTSVNEKTRQSNLNESKNSELLSTINNCMEPASENIQLDCEEPISWAKVLDPKNPIPVRYFRNTASFSDSKSCDELDNISLFELLEKKAEEGSFSLNFTKIRQWITNRTNLGLNIREDDQNESISIKQMKSTISPIPFDIGKEIVLDESDESSEESVDSKPEKGHVRFNEEVQINEVESDIESVLSNEIESMNVSKTSTPNQKDLFEKFKSELFGESDLSKKDDSTLIDDKPFLEEKKQEILEKSELLKSRLNELEGEILTFKQHNTELTKLKQEHELEKIQWQQEKCEMEEKLNDEKIKIEIYLHDERMKIEEERKKVEKMLKEQKLPNRKEREEIIKLREQVENLQQENKNKESRHVAAQSRLRAQIRVLEKEIKDLNFEREHLKKEIKKLESENARLNRMNNNKVLQEINRTISKLAPKVETSEVRNKSTKPVVAKVVSYQKKRKNSKSKSVPDLSREETDSTCEESDDTSSEASKTELEHSKYFPKNASCDNITGRKRSKSGDRCQEKRKSENISSSSTSKNDLRREIINTDGSKDIWYPNGNLKKISADGMTIRMLYYNKDIKETNISEGTIKYYYAETNTWHTTYLDGLEILEFPNGQTEHRYKDGTIEVHFPNGSIRISNPTDEHKAEEWRYPDGTTLVQMKNGDKILSLPNGQKEIHTKIHKRREYPDGTVKIVYPDGSQETRYSNGRVRLKDKDGNLVMDSENSNY